MGMTESGNFLSSASFKGGIHEVEKRLKSFLWTSRITGTGLMLTFHILRPRFFLSQSIFISLKFINGCSPGLQFSSFILTIDLYRDGRVISRVGSRYLVTENNLAMIDAIRSMFSSFA